MIHTTPNSGKFRRLVRRLRPLVGTVPVAVETIAVGLLERLWHIATAEAIRGDVGRFDDEELAEMVGWHGDAEALVCLLVEEKWLDRCDVHRVLIHDWNDHAPRHVKANAARQGGILTPAQGTLLTPQNDAKERSYRNPPNVAPDPVRSAPNIAKERTPNLTQPNLTQPKAPQTPQGDCRPLLDDQDDDPADHPPPEKPETEAAAQAWRELIAVWNATPGVTKCLAGNEARRKSMRVRLGERVLLDGKPVPWLQAAVTALQRKFPLKIRDGDPDGWKPDIDWFLRPASVLKLLEGKYDWSKNDGKRSRDSGAGQRFDPATAGGPVEGW